MSKLANLNIVKSLAIFQMAILAYLIGGVVCSPAESAPKKVDPRVAAMQEIQRVSWLVSDLYRTSLAFCPSARSDLTAPPSPQDPFVHEDGASDSPNVVQADISQMAPKRRPIEGTIAVWDGIAQPDFGVLALSAAP